MSSSSSINSIKRLPEVEAVHCLSLEAFECLLAPFEIVYSCTLTRDLLGGGDPSRPRQRLYAVHLTACRGGPIRFFTARAAAVAVLGQHAELVYPLRRQGSWPSVASTAERLQGELADCLEQLLQASPRCCKVVSEARHWLPDNVVWATPLGEVKQLALVEGHWQVAWPRQESSREALQGEASNDVQ